VRTACSTRAPGSAARPVFLAGRHGCQVTTIDLTDEYCETARWLNGLVGLSAKISVGRADVTDLAFGDAVFDVAFGQHVQMNVADKPRLYAEARRGLSAGGRLAIWDITAGAPGGLGHPLPWADQPDHSHLAAPAGPQAMIESASFVVDQWNDLTDQAAALMRAVLARPAGPLGLHAFVPDFAAKAGNLTAALASGRLRVIQAIAVAAEPR
jgi:ubiquinone/menaquinone biosynthesis C-methylase UbiE